MKLKEGRKPDETRRSVGLSSSVEIVSSRIKAGEKRNKKKEKCTECRGWQDDVKLYSQAGAAQRDANCGDV